MDHLATGAYGLSRRRFLQGSAALAGLALVSGCSRLPMRVQPAKVRRIGLLDGAAARDETQFNPFRDRLRDLGYVEGENLVIEERHTGDQTRYPAIIAELEAAGVETIVCGGMLVCLAVKEANPPIPTVAWIPATDPVFYGLVQNIARPEGNITGIAGTPGLLLGGKRLEILHAAVPDARRIGVLAPAGWPDLDVGFQNLKVAASGLGLDLEIAIVQDPSGIEPALSDLKAAGVGAVHLIPGTMLITPEVRSRTAELLRAHRLPASSPDTTFPRVGGFLSYSPDFADAASRVAWYVGQILRGVKPADLPMQRPTEFVLIINLKTAQTLGLTIPQEIVAQATEVIQ